jgi:hypothetical protein
VASPDLALTSTVCSLRGYGGTRVSKGRAASAAYGEV